MKKRYHLFILLFFLTACSQSKEAQHIATHTENTTYSMQSTDASFKKTSVNLTNEAQLLTYLMENHSIAGVHYEVSRTPRPNTTTGKYNYAITMLPDNKEVDEQISTALKEIAKQYQKNVVEDTNCVALFTQAREISTTLPLLEETIHVEQVSWISYDGSFGYLFLQETPQTVLY